MGIRDLFFNIKAKDQTGQAFSRVNANLRKTEGMAARTSEKLGRMGRGMVGIGKSSALMTAPILFAFRDSLRLYDEQERARAKVEQGIKSTGMAAGLTADQLFETSVALQNVTRFGDELILDNVTAQLLTFTNIAGDQFLMAQERALDLSTVLDGDLRSATIMLGKALNDPVKGLSAMSRAGVTFSKSQSDVIKALAKTGDIAGAQNMILKELEKQYGGQARKAAEAGLGAMAQLSNSWGDLKEEVGGVIGELLPPVVDFFKVAIKGFTDLPEPVKKFTVIASGLALVLGPLVGVFGLLLIGVTAISAPVLAVGAGVVALTAAVVAFMPEIMAVTTYLIDGVVVAFNRVRDGVFLMRDGVLSAWSAIKDSIVGAVDIIGTYLTEKLNSILDSVGRKVEWVEKKFAWLYNEVVGNSWIPDMVDEVGQNMARLDPLMVRKADETTAATSSAFETLGSDVSDSLKNMVTNGKASWYDLTDAYMDAGDRLVDDLLSTVFDPIGNMVQEAFNGLSGLGSAGGSGGGGGGGFLAGLGNFASGLIGMDTGGELAVGGRAGMDRNVASLRVTQGETIKVTKRGQTGGGNPINIYIQTPDPTAFQQSKGQISAQIGRAVGRAGRYA